MKGITNVSRDSFHHTTRTRQIESRGEERDLECKAPTNGKLPLSPPRLVEPTCLLDMTKIPLSFS